MGPKDVIAKSLDMSDFVLKSYLADLSDADLLLKPVEGMHPIALQLGHLIATERYVNDLIKPGAHPSSSGRLREGSRHQERKPG